MKRTLTALLSIILTLGAFSACGNADSSEEAVTPTTTATATTTTNTEKPDETTAQTEAATSEPENDPADSAATRVVLDVENIPMLPELPTGSAIASAAMVLNYYGIECDKMDLLEYLRMSKRHYPWVAPFDYFCGDPRETNDSFGSASPVIIDMINDYLSANNITDYIAEYSDPYIVDVIDNELLKGNPVIIWATVDMEPISGYEEWNTEDNSLVTWPLNTHCVVLIGYDTEKDTLIVNDPLQGVVEYPREKVVGRCLDQYSENVVLRKK